MKKTRAVRLICLLAVMLLVGSQMAVGVFAGTEDIKYNQGTYNYVNGQSKYNAPAVDLGETTEGIEASVDKAKNKITYTIPAGFDAATINFNTMKDVYEVLGGTYTPGAYNDFTIEVVNESEHNYGYKEKSFVVTTEDLNQHFKEGEVYSYVNGTTTEGRINGAKGFDGSIIGYRYGISRTMNAAIQSLLGDKFPSDSAMSDVNLGKELKKLGYTNGVQDLAHYYLDFYNEKYGTDATKIEDLSIEALTSYDGGLFNGNCASMRETCVEVAEAGYNFFYNKCLGIIRADDEKPFGDAFPSEYSVGSYMKSYANQEDGAYEEFCKNAFGNLTPNSQGSLDDFTMSIHGPNTTNAFQNLAFGFYVGFQLENTDPQFYYDGSVSITKNVTENGQPYQVSTTFYAALFNDEACTDLVKDADGQPIILPLEMNGADSVTVTRDTIPRGTFYVAETDKDGNVVRSSEGHTVTLSSPTVTVGEIVGAVTITNEYSNYEGYYKEEGGNGTTTTNEVTKEETTDEAVKTGDDSSMVPYIVLLALAVAVGAGAVVTGRRHAKK